MRKINTQKIEHKNLNRGAAFVFVFILVGYPIQAAVPTLLGTDSTIFNAIIRALVTSVSVIIIVRQIFTGKIKINKKIIPFILFWIVYCLRLFIDLNVRGLSYSIERYTPFFIYSMAIGGCLIPALAISISVYKLNLVYIYKWIFIGCIIGNLAILLLISNQYNITSLPNIFFRRLVIQGQGGMSVINPISISFYGSLLFLLSLLNLFSFESFKKIGIPFKKFFIIIGLVIGFIDLLLGASRGPLIATILLAILIFCLFVGRSRKKGRILIPFILVLSIGLLMVAFGEFQSSLDNISVVERLGMFGNSDVINNLKDSDDRFQLYTSAWHQFNAHPIFGDKIMVNKFKIYPHNFILEVLMSLGLLGMTIVVICFYRAFSNAKSALKERISILMPYILFLFSYFLMSLTSFNIFTLPGLWLSLALLISIGKVSPIKKEVFTNVK